MISAIIGVGPRTGTSWVMRQLMEEGLPVYSTPGTDEVLPVEGNPEGYFETDLYERGGLEDVIIKVWPGPDMLNLEYDRVVVLRRERNSQLKSIRTQIVREGAQDVPYTPEQIIDLSDEWVDKLGVESKEYWTENLDEDNGEIIEYMRGSD